MAVLTQAFWESEQVASAISLLIMAIAGAITLYASSHWSAPKREERRKKREEEEEDQQ